MMKAKARQRIKPTITDGTLRQLPTNRNSVWIFERTFLPGRGKSTDLKHVANIGTD